MKRRFAALSSVVLYLFILSILPVIFAGASRAAETGLTRIAENVYSYVDVKNPSPATSFGSNGGIIIGRDGVVVVDTLMTAKEAKRFIKDIRAVTGKPIKYVVDTHYHLDHALGNAEFARLGAVIISHENDRANLAKNGEETLKRHGEYGISKEDMAGTEIALPNLTYDTKMTIELGDQSVILMHPGAAHTNGDTLVYLPDKKVLFTGDVLFTNFHPFLAEGDLASWGKVLDSILAMDVEKIIPGHGPLSTKKDVEDMKKYLIAFDGKAKELCSKSKDVKYIVAEMLKAVPPRQADFIVTSNIEMRCFKK